MLRRHPQLALLAVLLLLGWYAAELYYLRPQLSYLGTPQATTLHPATWSRTLRNDGFLLGYSDLRSNPLWVSYKLTPVAKDAKRLKRPQRFKRDWRTLTMVGHDDYRGSGFDRGHLAPNYAISRLYGRGAQLDTFLMSNITPQRPKLNQKLWQRLEEIEVDVFARRFGSLWVTTGPIFDGKIERMKSAMRVEIPDAFYKLYAAPPKKTGDAPQLLAFIIPQGVKGTEALDRFVVSVDEVEQRTGLDFFHILDDQQEQQLEAKQGGSSWRLKEVANRPGRY